MRHRADNDLQKCDTLPPILVGFIRVALGLVAKPQFMQRHPARIGGNDARRAEIARDHYLMRYYWQLFQFGSEILRLVSSTRKLYRLPTFIITFNSFIYN